MSRDDEKENIDSDGNSDGESDDEYEIPAWHKQFQDEHKQFQDEQLAMHQRSMARHDKNSELLATLLSKSMEKQDQATNIMATMLAQLTELNRNMTAPHSSSQQQLGASIPAATHVQQQQAPATATSTTAVSSATPAATQPQPPRQPAPATPHPRNLSASMPPVSSLTTPGTPSTVTGQHTFPITWLVGPKDPTYTDDYVNEENIELKSGRAIEYDGNALKTRIKYMKENNKLIRTINLVQFTELMSNLKREFDAKDTVLKYILCGDPRFDQNLIDKQRLSRIKLKIATEFRSLFHSTIQNQMDTEIPQYGDPDTPVKMYLFIRSQVAEQPQLATQLRKQLENMQYTETGKFNSFIANFQNKVKQIAHADDKQALDLYAVNNLLITVLPHTEYFHNTTQYLKRKITAWRVNRTEKEVNEKILHTLRQITLSHSIDKQAIKDDLYTAKRNNNTADIKNIQLSLQAFDYVHKHQSLLRHQQPTTTDKKERSQQSCRYWNQRYFY